MGIALDRINTPIDEYGKLLSLTHINDLISLFTTSSTSYTEIYKSGNISLHYPTVDIEFCYSLFVEVLTKPFQYSLKIEYTIDNEVSWVSLGETNGSEGSGDTTAYSSDTYISRRLYGKNKILIKGLSCPSRTLKIRFLIKAIQFSVDTATVNIPEQTSNITIFQYMNQAYFTGLQMSSIGRKLVESKLGIENDIGEIFYTTQHILLSTSAAVMTFTDAVTKETTSDLFLEYTIPIQSNTGAQGNTPSTTNNNYTVSYIVKLYMSINNGSTWVLKYTSKNISVTEVGITQNVTMDDVISDFVYINNVSYTSLKFRLLLEYYAKGVADGNRGVKINRTTSSNDYTDIRPALSNEMKCSIKYLEILN